MTPYLEIRTADRTDIVLLDQDTTTVGRGDDTTVALRRDESVSRLHATVLRLGAGWVLRDLGSRNGTFVNGRRLDGDRALRDGDEITIGVALLRFHASPAAAAAMAPTVARGGTPDLTRREREVLVALCRPVIAGGVIAQPASTRAIAARLCVTDDAIKHHLLRLYDKFAIHDGAGEGRRVGLAREAILRGVVSRSDVAD